MLIGKERETVFVYKLWQLLKQIYEVWIEWHVKHEEKPCKEKKNSYFYDEIQTLDFN